MTRFFSAYLLILGFLVSSCEDDKKPTSVFSLHLFTEPQQLDPALAQASSASYLFYNTRRGLYRINENNKLVEEGGYCQWKTHEEMHCQLKPDQWSDGKDVTAHDYVRAFRHLVDASVGAPRASLLNHIKNAEAIVKGKRPPNSLGVMAKDPKTLVLHFKEFDPEFLFKLSSTALYPRPGSPVRGRDDYKSFKSNGPYQIDRWQFGKEITLTPNPYYTRGAKNRPPVRLFFIEDELTALRLYEKGDLSFLRRVPSQLIAKFQSRADFIQIPMLRFDYIGFGKKLLSKPILRKALVHAIDYEQFRILLGGLERPGCPSIPKTWFIKQRCYEFDLDKAQQLIAKLPAQEKQMVYEFKVSDLGGLDVKKQAEFLQNQWKKHLGIEVNVGQVDQKIFISQLRKEPYDIFRKGIGLDRPTCFNALESFTLDSSRNYLRYNDESYLRFLKKMKEYKSDSEPYKKLCQQAVDHLLDEYRIIPMGEMHFTMLASPEFQGWTINGLNQLDLGHLKTSR